jgi:hypothetical protein
MTIFNTTNPIIISIYEDYLFIKQICRELKEKIRRAMHERSTLISYKYYDRFIRNKVLRFVPQDQIARIERINFTYMGRWNWEDILLTSQILLKRMKTDLKEKLNEKILTPKLFEECPVCLDDENDVFEGYFGCCHSMCNDCYKQLNNKICPICRSR